MTEEPTKYDNTATIEARYNLTESFVENINSKYCRQHWLIRKAINNPNKEIEYWYEDKHWGKVIRRYRCIVVFSNNRNVLIAKGNAPFTCPHYTGHHVGSTCGTCGQVD